MVIKVKDRPYFFVIITRLLKDNLKCLVNKQPKIEDKKYNCFFILVIVHLAGNARERASIRMRWGRVYNDL